MAEGSVLETQTFVRTAFQTGQLPCTVYPPFIMAESGGFAPQGVTLDPFSRRSHQLQCFTLQTLMAEGGLIESHAFQHNLVSNQFRHPERFTL